MRVLNHEHIFRLPLTAQNAVDLDSISSGLAAVAGELRQDADYCGQVVALGARYLEDGDSLVHGDYFPGSWVRTSSGVRIIDPEFCFLGTGENSTTASCSGILHSPVWVSDSLNACSSRHAMSGSTRRSLSASRERKLCAV